MNAPEGVGQGNGRLRPSSGQFKRTLALMCCAFLAAGTAATAQTAPANPDPKVKIAFVGDSLADGIWGGTAALAPRNACLKGVELGRFAKNSTGLTRPDKFSWPDE